MKTMKLAMKLVFALALGVSSIAGATVPIQFDPNGAGGPGVSVGTFDWVPGNALLVGGNPAGGLVVGSQVTVLAHSRLGSIIDPNGNNLNAFLPPNAEFTFIGGAAETVIAGGNAVGFVITQLNPNDLTHNFFEVWTSTPDADMLAGTGFNNGKRILAGQVTNAIGNYTVTTCPDGVSATTQFDQFLTNNYPGVSTICGIGATNITVNVFSVDTNYFPGITPASLATLTTVFNTSTVTPFNQADPSHNFVEFSSGNSGPPTPTSPTPPPNGIGTVNGGLQFASLLDFQTQADANQSFQQGQIVAGACRVTYGGNAPNGNVDITRFSTACDQGSGSKINCYTFGGQVGAPTANPAAGGPFGEHTHHNTSGPAGDFVFRAGTHSAPSNTRITATACKDPGACRPAEANAGFKQIDFEGTGSFRTLDDEATAYFQSKGVTVLPDNQSSATYYFRVDMDDTGEPGNKFGKTGPSSACAAFLAADQNNPLTTPDPPVGNLCAVCPDVYQIVICKDATPCNPGSANSIYEVRGFLTGGNIQIHQVIK